MTHLIVTGGGLDRSAGRDLLFGSCPAKEAEGDPRWSRACPGGALLRELASHAGHISGTGVSLIWRCLGSETERLLAAAAMACCASPKLHHQAPFAIAPFLLRVSGGLYRIQCIEARKAS